MPSASSSTEIVNQALEMLGAQPITSLDDTTSEAAKRAKRTFHRIRESLLQSHNWNFAQERRELAADTATPLYDKQYAYRIPSDMWKVLEVNGEDVDSRRWKVLGRRIETDIEAPLQVRGQVLHDRYGEYPPLFVEALAAKCAADWAYAVTQKPELQGNMEAIYDKRLLEALVADGQEGMLEPVEANTWIYARGV